MQEELQITSPAFQPGDSIPVKYTADGENINPPLSIRGVSSNTKSLVLIVDDPDAETDPNGPGKVYDHWIVFNIPPNTTEIAENSVPVGATQAKNGSDENKYVGPAPPTGTHRYIFQLYELSAPLDLDANTNKADVQAELESVLINAARLVGTYQHTPAQ
jgi:Raf kinase inhibitor-like YbhB/YbcL family protein